MCLHDIIIVVQIQQLKHDIFIVVQIQQLKQCLIILFVSNQIEWYHKIGMCPAHHVLVW
jgi:hypothetical protein